MSTRTRHHSDRLPPALPNGEGRTPAGNAKTTGSQADLARSPFALRPALKPMKIQFHLRGLNLASGLRDRLAQSIENMERLIPVSAAAVVLEYARDNGTAFRAFALLAVPGPDIHAEARDHTLAAAWLKLTHALRRQIERRRTRREVRWKRNGPLRAPVVRQGRSMAGLRA